MLNRIRQPFNVNSLAMSGAVAALNDRDFIEQSVQCNADGLVRLRDGLVKMGVDCCPSAANFLLADFGRPVDTLYEALLRQGVIVRPVGNYGLENHLRITVGNAEQNEKLLHATRQALADN